MPVAQTHEPSLARPLRLWPGVAAAALQLLFGVVLPIVLPAARPYAMLAGLVLGLVIILWWVFFSRAPWIERLGALLLMFVAVLATRPAVHESIKGGMMGMMLPVFSIPVMTFALVAWAVATRRLAPGPRRVAMVAAILIAPAVWTLARTEGITGGGSAELKWRWTQTPEERFLAQARSEPPPAPVPEKPAAPATPQAGDEPAKPSSTPPEAKAEPTAVPVPAVRRADWSGFRGSDRNGVIHGVRLETNWSASPPVELWRRPIGPGWSSFAINGDLLYTQEQRGDEEVVTCYNVTTGKPVWKHGDAARFWESNGGAGPRATPTVSNGRVYSLGATGILNALDAGNGAVLWSRNAASDTGAEVPYWGFSSSPVVAGDVVVAYTGGLAGYDRATGKPRWVGKPGGTSYSSPQLVTIAGVVQIVQLTEAGAIGVAPADGTVLWEHPWAGGAIVQPAMTADGDLLINAIAMTGGLGTRRLAVAQKSGTWSVEERWTSTGLKPYFNDFVVHDGHAFGFDGNILACIDLADGKRKWKGGRYGNGQLVVLPEQDLLLVLSEEGELALVRATPDQFTEVARFPAIEGKTWNHPALVGDVLLVRNGEEMAAFRLPLAAGAAR